MARGDSGLDRLKHLAALTALPDRPLRRLPRWAGIALLIAVALVCIWNFGALQQREVVLDADMAQHTARGDRHDMDLYRTINARVAAGEGYYRVATDEQRRSGYPTSPFVAVRTPVLAWTTAIWGSMGWRILAIALWAGNIIAWYAVLAPRASRLERIGAAIGCGTFGVIALVPVVATSHEALAGLIVSLALALRDRFPPVALALALFATALRLLALPFLLLWGALSVMERRWREAAMVGVAIALAVVGIVLHARAVAAARLPGDIASQGWEGLVGPALPLYGIHLVTMLQDLPRWISAPLGVLPLLGWAAIGGRHASFALAWMIGYMAMVAIFARPDNFYWLALLVPAYGVGLAFVPRAVADCLSAPTPSSPQSPRRATATP